MSDYERMQSEVFPEMFRMLPVHMDSPAARAEMLAIGLQESRFLHRKQIGGPAHGFWQFEQGGGCIGVLTHPASKNLMETICQMRKVMPASRPLYEAIVNDDVLAAAAARLLLYTLPARLPQKDQLQYGWNQYIEAWRPGMPHRSTWDAFYHQAWNTVEGVIA